MSEFVLDTPLQTGTRIGQAETGILLCIETGVFGQFVTDFALNTDVVTFPMASRAPVMGTARTSMVAVGPITVRFFSRSVTVR